MQLHRICRIELEFGGRNRLILYRETFELEENKGVLYLCATPIGNLEDITLRALRVLREVDLIAAEDTRHTRKLLSHFDIHTPLTSYHEHNKQKKGDYLIQLLSSGKQVALVSDAGLPGVSDPGEELVRQALEKSIRVVPLPGASAAITALVVSGLPAGSFVFEGFLPSAKKARRDKLEGLKHERRTLIFYEGPHRVPATLADIREVFGDRRMAAARELTKQHEEVIRGTVTEVLDCFRQKEPRGEFTLVIAGCGREAIPMSGNAVFNHLKPAEHVALLEKGGMERREAVREVARLRGLPKREVYNEVVRDVEK